MATTTISLRELSEDTERSVAADCNGPVIVTEGRRPAHVLLSYDGYRALVDGRAEDVTNRADPNEAATAAAPHRTLVDMLAMPELDTLPDDFEFPKAEFHFQIPDLAD